MAQMSINSTIKNIYSYNGTLHSNEKEWTVANLKNDLIPFIGLAKKLGSILCDRNILWISCGFLTSINRYVTELSQITFSVLYGQPSSSKGSNRFRDLTGGKYQLFLLASWISRKSRWWVATCLGKKKQPKLQLHS